MSVLKTRRHAVEVLLGLGVGVCSPICRRANAEMTHRELAFTHQPELRSRAPWLTLPPTPALPHAMRSGLTAINGTRIFFAQFGAGPPVLLLHGGLANSDYWGHQIRQLAQIYSVTVMDTRGHGRSPVTSAYFSYPLFAQDVIALLNFLEIPQTSVIGWSDGAITGLQLAMTNPDRISKLFAFGANSSIDGLKAAGGRSSVFVLFAKRCKTEYGLLSPQPEKWPELINGLRVMWRNEPNFTTQKLHTVTVPTTISDGDYDEIVKRDHTEQLANAIPGARLVIQRAVSHFAMLQDPDQFNKALIDFLSGQN